MPELKTRPQKQSVTAFLNAIEDEARRRDAKAVHKLMREVTGNRAEMWGASIVGYGRSTQVYADGKTHEWMTVGFSPRKTALTLYIMDGFKGRATLLKKLGKHKTGKACLYIKRLSDVDPEVLRELVETSVAAKRAQ